MHIEIQQSILLPMLAQLVPIAEHKSTMPSLTHIHVNAEQIDIAAGQLTLTANDLETGLQFVSNELIVHEFGTVLLPGKKFHEIVREMPAGTITIQHDSATQRTTLTCQSTKFRLAGMDPADFPQVAEVADIELQAIDKGLLQSLIAHTSFAASTNDSRFNLNSVCLYRPQEVDSNSNDSDVSSSSSPTNPSHPPIRCVATDGHRLACASTHSDSVPNVMLAIVPLKSAIQLNKFLDKAGSKNSEHDSISFGTTDKLMSLQTVNESGNQTATLSIRLIAGDFPNVDKVIPSSDANHTSIQIDKAALTKSIKRASLFTEQRLPGIRMVFEQNQITLLSNIQDIGQAEDVIECEWTNWSGEIVERIVNADYFLEGLSHVDGERVTLKIHDDGAPIVIAPVDGEGSGNNETGTPIFTHFNLVMPMRK